MKLCDRILELIDKSEEDPTVRAFLEEFRDSPQFVKTNGIVCRFFLELGFCLWSDDRSIFSANLYVSFAEDQPSPDGIAILKVFGNPLPFGIDAHDNRAAIHMKFGPPISPEKKNSDEYAIGDYCVILCYRANEILTEIRIVSR